MTGQAQQNGTVVIIAGNVKRSFEKPRRQPDKLGKMQIIFKCNHCKGEYEDNRTEEIPENATMVIQNFCLLCEEFMNDYYHETYSYEPLPEPFNPNQLTLL